MGGHGWRLPGQSLTDHVRFHVAGPPVRKGRPRFTSRGGKVITYTPAETTAYEQLVAWSYRIAAGAQRFESDVEVWIDVHERTSHPADLDNYVKAILDGLNGVAWADDRSVVELHSRVLRKAALPGVDVSIRPVRPALWRRLWKMFAEARTRP